MTGVNDILLASAELYGPARAVVAGATVLTYTDLHETVVRYARRMRAAGLRRGSVVAVRIDRSADTLPIFLATQWIGAIYLPIDERQPPARFRYMIQDARCDGLIVEDGLDVGDQDPGLRIILRRSELAEPSTADGAPESGDGAYLLYTSGSTGLPKAVPISSANLSVLTGWLRTAYTPAEMACSAFTISVAFDVSFPEMLGPLMHGGTLVVFEDLYATGATDQAITALTNTPSNLARYLEHWELPESLLVVTAAGEPLRADLSQRILATVPRLLNGYGPTEATVYTTVHEVRPSDLERAAIPIGRPLDGVVLTVRREDGTPCDDGEPGELYISGPSVSAGYLSAQAGRSEAFFREPGAAYPTYRSGDIVVRHPDGLFDCLGRRDRQCKINGIRVDLLEVTTWLLRCAGVANGHVCTRETPAGRVLAAFVTALPGASPDPAKIRAELATVLARYAVPQDVVVVGELPVTLSGKVDDAALLARLDATSQDPVTALVELCLAPATGADDEWPLAAMTSLELIDFRRRMLQEHGIDLPLQLIYRCREVTELAELVRSRRGGAGVAAPAAPAAPQECGIGEQNIWLADMVDPEACANNEVYRLTFAQPVDHARIETALRQCVLDLPALRTSYRYSRGRLVKEIADPGAAVARLDPPATDVARRPFDLAAPLKIRACPAAGDPCAVLLTVHHIAIDAEAIDVLLEHFDAVLDGRPAAPQDPPGPPSWAVTADREQLLRFWRERLAALPSDGPKLGGGSGVATRQVVTLDAAERARLHRQAAAARTTPFGVLHAALTTALCRELGLPAVSLGTPTTSRSAGDRRVGLMSNMVPLVATARAEGEPAVSYLERLRRELLETIEHCAISLSDLRSALPDPGATLMHGMLAEVRKPGPAVRGFDAEEVFTGVLKMPLMFLFEDRPDRFQLTCEYAVDGELGGRITNLLDATVAEIRELIGGHRPAYRQPITEGSPT